MSARAKALLLVLLAVVILCPVTGVVPSQALGVVQLSQGQDMADMACPVSSCQVGRIETARQDIRQAIAERLVQDPTVGGSAVVTGAELQSTRTKLVTNLAHPISAYRLPLYLLHVSLIR